MDPATAWLLANVCSWNPDKARFDRDCGPVIEQHFRDARSAKRVCEDRAIELRSTSPAGTKVIDHACLSERPTLVATRTR